MKKHIKTRFMPTSYAVEIDQRCHNLKQRDMDVVTYTEEFYKWTARAELQESDATRLARYLNGLKKILGEKISTHHIWDVEDAYELALKVE